jgi:hypothetical protein
LASGLLLRLEMGFKFIEPYGDMVANFETGDVSGGMPIENTATVLFAGVPEDMSGNRANAVQDKWLFPRHRL